jgi:threonine synthase
MAAENLRCKECRTEYPLDARYVCERCFGPLEVAYDHSRLTDVEELKRRIQGGPQNIWRYADFLPLEAPPGPSGRASSRVGLPAGCTPLIKADRLAERLGLGEVWIKNDAANPTHSFKDRVVSVAVARARELGFNVIACASTGNLANSVAAHGAALGLESYVFVPSDLEEQKILATGVYGTHLVAVNGNYDDVNRCAPSCRASATGRSSTSTCARTTPRAPRRWPSRSPSSSAGSCPTAVVAPIASGSLFTKINRGFEEWLELGLIEGDVPVMNGAQALGCSPVATAFADGTDVCKPVKPDTIAKSLAIGNPADGPYAVELASAPAGRSTASPTTRSARASACWPRRTGIFTETAGGVTTATLAKLAARGDIGPDERSSCSSPARA